MLRVVVLPLLRVQTTLTGLCRLVKREARVFGIGGPELVVILIIALLFVGPDKLPQVAKTVATSLRDLRRVANLTQHELKTAMDDLAREVEKLPENQPVQPKPVAEKAPSQMENPGDPELDKPAPTVNTGNRPHPLLNHPAMAQVPAEGETLAVVEKRQSPYAISPASGTRARGEEAAETPAADDIPDA